mmetsp:Transcript_19770/g.62239  ORF Transcript_19770/g.62239 Transcript_19770/m.62239 type:complete len:421 (+) Transcript_19770:61-1323(+)
MRVVVCAAALGAAISAVSGEERSPPSLPKSFVAVAYYVTNSSTFNLCAFSPNGDCDEYPIEIVQDDVRQRSATVANSIDKYAPAAYVGTGMEWFNITLIKNNGSYFDVISNLCYPSTADGSYSDMFAWVARSTYAGRVEIDGVECEAWTSGMANTYRYLAVTTNGSIPVQYNETIRGETFTSYSFISFDAGVADHEAFAIVENGTACYDPPTCGDDPSVVEQDVYVFHPSDSFDVAGQDVGDQRGDTFFVCEDELIGTSASAFDHDYALVTKWRLRRLGTIGQYQNCNGYPSSCAGENDFYVGKEAALGLGYPSAGQCTANNLTGNWYSLPERGQCSDFADVGDNCSWAVSHVKTINGTCLLYDLGFLDKCADDGQAPFRTAERTFDAAFTYDDPAQGGCSPLSYPDQVHLASSPRLALA